VFKEITYLLQKEIKLELRQKYTLGSIILYVVSTIFVCHMSFREIVEIPTWNALFWVIMLFTSVNAISKSFLHESGGKQLYIYTLASPQAVILSKIIYNTLLMVFITAISFVVYSIFVGSVVLEGANMEMYLLALFLGSTGFSGALTMVSAIASKTNNNLGLMAILGFPIILPLLITVINFTDLALRGQGWIISGQYILVLAAINLLIVGMSYLLFPYLWRE
jgi:heme exporter protein B